MPALTFFLKYDIIQGMRTPKNRNQRILLHVLAFANSSVKYILFERYEIMTEIKGHIEMLLSYYQFLSKIKWQKGLQSTF